MVIYPIMLSRVQDVEELSCREPNSRYLHKLVEADTGPCKFLDRSRRGRDSLRRKCESCERTRGEC